MFALALAIATLGGCIGAPSDDADTGAQLDIEATDVDGENTLVTTSRALVWETPALGVIADGTVTSLVPDAADG